MEGRAADAARVAAEGRAEHRTPDGVRSRVRGLAHVGPAAGSRACRLAHLRLNCVSTRRICRPARKAEEIRLWMRERAGDFRRAAREHAQRCVTRLSDLRRCAIKAQVDADRLRAIMAADSELHVARSARSPGPYVHQRGAAGGRCGAPRSSRWRR